MTYTYDNWLALGATLKLAKRPFLNPKSFEEAYPERVAGRQYYRDHPELLTVQKRTELIFESARFMIRHIADSVPQWRGN